MLRNLLFRVSLPARPWFPGSLAIVGDGFPDNPVGNGLGGEGDQEGEREEGSADHLPSIVLNPSHRAPTKPPTIAVTTILNV
jgi:hypothetical protein